MSGITAATAGLIAAGVGAAGTAITAHMNSIAQGQQADKAAQLAQATGTAQKATPADTSGLNAGGTPASAGVNSGPASTLLTGSGGVANSALNLGGPGGLLGSNSLLGQ